MTPGGKPASGDDPADAAIVEAVRRFVAKDVRPHVARLERDPGYPEALVKSMRELGLFGLVIAEEHGGLGVRLPVFAAVIEELAKGWASLAAYLNSHSTVAYVIGRHGTDGQRSLHLPRMATAKRRGALLDGGRCRLRSPVHRHDGAPSAITSSSTAARSSSPMERGRRCCSHW
jgi:alkylation response protein AidB-like acyl-CoA dehydrogenase